MNTFSYNEGKLPIIDVLSAQVSWLQAYTNVVSVNYQYKVALAEYAKALGNGPLSLSGITARIPEDDSR